MARDLLQHGRMVTLFAERVLRTPGMTPDDMPELSGNPAFGKLSTRERASVARSIKHGAASKLIETGYPEATVKRILRV